MKPFDQYDSDFDFVMDALNNFHFCAEYAIPIEGDLSGDDTVLSAFERMLTHNKTLLLRIMELREKFSQALKTFLLDSRDPSWIPIMMEKFTHH